MSPGPGKFTMPPRWRFFLLAVIRPLATVTVLVVVYYLLPVDRKLTSWTLVQFIVGLVLVAVVIVWQVWRIMRSPYAAVQGIEALAVVIPLFLLLFANGYYVLEHNLAHSFTTPLTRTDALYFTVTVFTTVGFGDITAASQTARILVTVQMIGDLIVLGGVLRVIIGAIRRRRQGGSPPIRRRQ